MIAMISGKIFSKSASYIIVDVNGVGYRLFVPLSTYASLKEKGEAVSLLTYTHVSEDAMVLYGFFTEEEKKLFEILLTVSKIGPKIALNILSGITPHDLISALRNNDIGRLSLISGIGKKTAERIIVELKDKIAKVFSDAAVPVSTGTEKIDKDFEDAISALVNLGYKNEAAKKVIGDILSKSKDNITCEGLIRQGLKELANGR